MAAEDTTVDEADSRLKDIAAEAERRVREQAEVLKSRARDVYDDAQERFDLAQRYVTEQVQEKPLAATLTAVGVGVILGLLLAGRRR